MAAPTTATSLRLLALSAVVLAVGLVTAAPGKRYRVGGQDGWLVPPPEGKEKYYVEWASTITFYVDDSIEFVYRNDSVIRVGKAGYYHCNETAAAGVAPRDGSTVFLLDAPGYAYFASADLDHCRMGERLVVDVLAAGAQPLAPSPWSAAPGPWSWVLSPTSPVPPSAAAAPVPLSSVDAVFLIVHVAMALAAALV